MSQTRAEQIAAHNYFEARTFAMAHLDPDPDGFMSGDALHRLYREWLAQTSGGKPMSRRALLRQLGATYAVKRCRFRGTRDRGLAVRARVAT